MKHFLPLPAAALCLLLAAASCGDRPFISDAAVRQSVHQDFLVKQEQLPRGDLFAICRADSLTQQERGALEFLYAYMPLADVAAYPGEFHLQNVRTALQARREMPWGDSVPDDVFRHFVLPPRVNNEQLDYARPIFYRELKGRVEGLSLRDAVLEVNHWCHEKAVYQPTDARTSSPLFTVLTAYGRCGEESTLLVAALRSLCIPARQVYTPRWAHTDDNHAWVEAWVDGRWHFLGACEPEPVLDLAWFNAPASRGMLMHTKVFGRYTGPEEVMTVTPNYTEINVIDNYAPACSPAVVTVADADGHPVPHARVEFKLYNYAEFYTVATKQADAQGRCSLTAGHGDMLVWASDAEGRFGFAKLSFGKQRELTVVLDKREGDHFSLDLDIVPPAEHALLPQVTPEQRAANDRRLAQEDSIRHAYEATMMTAAQAKEFLDHLSKFTPSEKEKLADLLVACRGNHDTMRAFLMFANAVGNTERAFQLLSTLTEKDLRDVCDAVLLDHWRNTPSVASDRYLSALLNPRVSTEELTPYKGFFQHALGEELAQAYREQPQRLVAWCRDSIAICDTLNLGANPIIPAGVWRSRVADRRSRDILFVSMARSVGIPAWIDGVTGRVCYQDLLNHKELKEGATYEVDFEREGAKVLPPAGRVVATYTPTKVFDDPKYYSHFTLSRCEKGVLQLQSYDEGSATWSRLLKAPRRMPAGYYVMTTGVRLANGGVLAHLESFNVKVGETTRVPLVMRETREQIQVIGSFNSESLFTPVQDGKVSDEATSILKACGRGYFVIGVLGAGQEPTNHALKDIAKLGKELEAWGRKLVLLFPDEAQFRKYRPEDFAGLPSTIQYGIDTHGIASQIVREMKLSGAGSLPLFIIADTFNRVVFVSQGYTIGLGEQLMRTVHGL